MRRDKRCLGILGRSGARCTVESVIKIVKDKDICHYDFKYLFISYDFIIFSIKMVKIGLQIKAYLENVTDLEAEGEDFR